MVDGLTLTGRWAGRTRTGLLHDKHEGYGVVPASGVYSVLLRHRTTQGGPTEQGREG